MKNINEYHEEEFFKKFKNSDITSNIEKDFDLLSWKKNFKWPHNETGITPREMIGDINHKPHRSKTWMSMVPYYYLNYLLEKSPESIYDLGCGWNIFKKYIPNIIGVGAEPIESEYYYGDIHDVVDDDFIKGHHEYFDSVFSINSLHFTSLTNIRKVVLDFSSMIKKNGRGFLALNLMRMIEGTETGIVNPLFNYDFFIRQELGSVPFTYLVFDVDLNERDDSMDGNIRLVIEK
jgi:hypothetical protein